MWPLNWHPAASVGAARLALEKSSARLPLLLKTRLMPGLIFTTSLFTIFTILPVNEEAVKSRQLSILGIAWHYSDHFSLLVIFRY